ncbi:hypothetical protein HAINFHK1212_1563 [Haemophilus influenzae HK1212]|uniref:Uncharacterized protein n=1 Tax=Haemophilus influenzae HK1212 TaxID=456482 RepID=A0A7G2K0W4_HAEIF|nr:hypothetical protein HAINFHK1212_1563 [Haemophilus influenzae HK1212]
MAVYFVDVGLGLSSRPSINLGHNHSFLRAIHARQFS